jgi:DNA replication protein DnaC
MIMIKKYQSKITQMYEDIRISEENSLKERKAEIEKNLPEVMKIEREIGKLGIRLSIEILNNSKDIETILNTLKEKITELRIRKSELLVSNGYPMDYLESHHRCKKCSDTGYIGSEKCPCYKNKLISIYYEDSDLKRMIRENNFSNFNFELFSGTRRNSEPKSPRKNMEEIASTAWNFIEKFSDSGENLLFFGGPGTGKTFLSNCIARELLDRGIFVVYRTSEELISDLKKIRFEGDAELEEILLRCDLLIIDDLGSEQITDFSKTELFNFINRKLLKGNKMLISTNCGLETLVKLYSERISSRLLGEFTLCKFYGEDIRISKNIKGKK